MEELKKMRNKLGLSQKSMATSIGVSLSMYEKVEQGRVRAGSKFMKKLKTAYPEANIDSIFFS